MVLFLVQHKELLILPFLRIYVEDIILIQLRLLLTQQYLLLILATILRMVQVKVRLKMLSTTWMRC